MKSKLTLNIEKEVTEKAKAYARYEGRSLSDLIEDILKMLVSEANNPEVRLSPRIKDLAGSIKLDQDLDYRKEYRDYIVKKSTDNNESVS